MMMLRSFPGFREWMRVHDNLITIYMRMKKNRDIAVVQDKEYG